MTYINKLKAPFNLSLIKAIIGAAEEELSQQRYLISIGTVAIRIGLKELINLFIHMMAILLIIITKTWIP